MKRYIFISLVVLLVLCAVIGVAYAEQDSTYSEGEIYSKGNEMISSITKLSFGDIEYVGPAPEGNVESFDDDAIEFEDQSYRYFLTKDSGYIKAILPKEESKKPLFSSINSIYDAEKAAITVASSAFPKLCTTDYDVFVKKIGEESTCFYSVEIWQKVNDKVYTGRKANVQLTADGRLELYVAIDTNFTEIPKEIKIDEQTAISLAYADCKNMVQKLEGDENNIKSQNSEIKPEDEETIISDNGTVLVENSTKFTPYKIYIDDTSNHKVKSYLTYKDNQMLWVVEISEVKTNRPWGNLAFKTVINSVTGEIVFDSPTR